MFIQYHWKFVHVSDAHSINNKHLNETIWGAVEHSGPKIDFPVYKSHFLTRPIKKFLIAFELWTEYEFSPTAAKFSSGPSVASIRIMKSLLIEFE